MTVIPEEPLATPIRIWRASRLSRWGLYLGGLFCVALGVTSMAAAIANPSAGAILPVALLLVAAFTFIRSAAYGAVALTEDGVEIKNLLGKRIITLASICSVDPGYNGLAITTNDGKSYTALVIQKTNVSRWMGRRTRADEIADAIRRAADLSVATGHSHAQAHQQPDRDLNDRDD